MVKKKIPPAPEGAKPRMPEEPIIAQGGAVKFKLDWDSEQFSSGSMRFKFEDTSARVMNDAEEEIGSVCGTIGGGLEIYLPNGRGWYLGVREIWEACLVADKSYEESVHASSHRKSD